MFQKRRSTYIMEKDDANDNDDVDFIDYFEEVCGNDDK